MDNKALKEIRTGENETSAAVSIAAGRLKMFSPSLGKLRLFTMVLIFIIIIAFGVGTYLKIFSASSSDINATTIVEQVQEIATLSTAKAVVTDVIKEEDNKLFDQKININLPGTKRIALIIVPATVLAGVDLKSLKEKDIQIDEKKKEITLKIPHATIFQEPSIQMDKIQTYSEEGVFRHDVNWNEGFNLAAQADTQIKKEAIDMGLLKTADDSAVKSLSHFFGLLGYKTQIKFQ